MVKPVIKYGRISQSKIESLFLLYTCVLWVGSSFLCMRSKLWKNAWSIKAYLTSSFEKRLSFKLVNLRDCKMMNLSDPPKEIYFLFVWDDILSRHIWRMCFCMGIIIPWIISISLSSFGYHYNAMNYHT